MSSINAPEYSRNFGFWNEHEQQAIMESHIAIGGVGGDGFELGLRLARMGVQEFTVADPEVFEPENSNRVPGANVQTYGLSKVDVFEEEILKINPEATVRKFAEGITEDNIKEFLGRATLAFDETELTRPELGTMLSDEARERGIPNVMVMNVGFAGQVTSFHPNGKYSFRHLMGIPEKMPLDEVAEQEIKLSRCLPYLPSYVDLETLKTLETDKTAPLPSIAPGVDAAAALGESQAFLHMVKPVSPRRQEPVWAPRMAWLDAMSIEGGKTSYPRLSYYRHLAKLVVRDSLGRNAKTSFSKEDRDRRAAAYEAE